MYRVRVKPSYRWPTAQVDGRGFGPTWETIADGHLTPQMLASPLLECVKVVQKRRAKPKEVADGK